MELYIRDKRDWGREGKQVETKQEEKRMEMCIDRILDTLGMWLVVDMWKGRGILMNVPGVTLLKNVVAWSIRKIASFVPASIQNMMTQGVVILLMF